MTLRPKLIATDLDGTLLRSDKTVSARTRTAIEAAQAQGLIFVIATARHPVTAKLFAEMAGISGLAICANGALVYDLASDEILSHITLPVETAVTIALQMRVAVPEVTFAVIRGMDLACEPEYAALGGLAEHGRAAGDIRMADIEILLDAPVTKLIARHPELLPPELLRRLTDLGLSGYESSLSGAPFVDMTAAGVSKAAALAEICAMRGIDAAEVIALGDAPNDLPMLRWSGRPIAVANAYPEVLAEIDEITARNDDDGVAIVVERLLG